MTKIFTNVSYSFNLNHKNKKLAYLNKYYKLISRVFELFHPDVCGVGIAVLNWLFDFWCPLKLWAVVEIKQQQNNTAIFLVLITIFYSISTVVFCTDATVLRNAVVCVKCVFFKPRSDARNTNKMSASDPILRALGKENSKERICRNKNCLRIFCERVSYVFVLKNPACKNAKITGFTKKWPFLAISCFSSSSL